MLLYTLCSILYLLQRFATAGMCGWHFITSCCLTYLNVSPLFLSAVKKMSELKSRGVKMLPSKDNHQKISVCEFQILIISSLLEFKLDKKVSVWKWGEIKSTLVWHLHHFSCCTVKGMGIVLTDKQHVQLQHEWTFSFRKRLKAQCNKKSSLTPIGSIGTTAASVSCACAFWRTVFFIFIFSPVSALVQGHLKSFPLFRKQPSGETGTDTKNTPSVLEMQF